MKRIYIKPEMVAVTCKMESVMLSKSESPREIAGGPYDDAGEKSLPSGVLDYTDPETQDPFGGHGQGTGGGGNRSKDWDDEVILDD